MTALGVLCCFALFVCLTLLAFFFLPSHLSFKNMYIPLQGTFVTNQETVALYRHMYVVDIDNKRPVDTGEVESSRRESRVPVRGTRSWHSRPTIPGVSSTNSSSIPFCLLYVRFVLWFSNVCRLRIIKTRTERGRPGTEANSKLQSSVKYCENMAIVGSWPPPFCARFNPIMGRGSFLHQTLRL